MNILGINSYFEHPAVALIQDGELVFAIEDERLTRIKHGKSYTPYRTFIPYDSIYAALRSEAITVHDLDRVAFSYNRWHHLRSLWGCVNGKRLSSLGEELAAFQSVCNIRPALQNGYELSHRYRDVVDPRVLGNLPYTEWDHHLCHAASAFYCSGFSEALVLVADGSGEKACTSVYIGNGARLKKIAEIALPNSLGFFYSYITAYLGFEPFSDEYKVMGLAAFGDDSYAEQMMRLVLLEPEGRYSVDLPLLKNLEQVFGRPKRQFNGALEQAHKDIARSAQLMLEKVTEHIARYHLKTSGMKRLCLAGGTFLNILVNARLGSLLADNELFVQPAGHDAGTAVGAAALSWVKMGGDPQIRYGSMFLGTEHNKAAIQKALEGANLTYVELDESEKPLRLADLLAQEKVIGVFRGRMEFGPRALGNRSILASPKSERTRAKLNELKAREQFRPLAPLVTSEAFDRYFIGFPNRYMMLAVSVREEYREVIPAIVHADGTARTQVVYKEHDPFLHSLLEEFEKKCGHPILINTSLNVRGKPIDESPYDALASFYTSGLDYILIGDFLVSRTSAQSDLLS